MSLKEKYKSINETYEKNKTLILEQVAGSRLCSINGSIKGKLKQQFNLTTNFFLVIVSTPPLFLFLCFLPLPSNCDSTEAMWMDQYVNCATLTANSTGSR